MKSDWTPVSLGVPQGTILGSLLLTLYINNILTYIEYKIRVFADDCLCNVEIKGKEDTMKLQNDIDRLVY